MEQEETITTAVTCPYCGHAHIVEVKLESLGNFVGSAYTTCCQGCNQMFAARKIVRVTFETLALWGEPTVRP